MDVEDENEIIFERLAQAGKVQGDVLYQEKELRGAAAMHMNLKFEEGTKDLVFNGPRKHFRATMTVFLKAAEICRRKGPAL